ncbi:hypothetical protein [Microlunatus endophyticus]
MISGEVLRNSDRSIDLRQILSRSELIMLDHQHRNQVDGFEQNTEAGKRLHELLGWDKLIPESTPQYQLGVPAFRVAAMPAAEVRLWATAGFAGGIQPWWHHIGSRHDDRRQYRTAAPLFGWHRDNSDILTDRTPIADVGIVWSQENNDFAGRDSAAERTLDPYKGVVRAVNAAGLGYLPLHADDLVAASGRVRVIVLPNVEVLADDQVAAVRRFVERGGSVIISGPVALQDGDGNPRSDSALADLFGVHLTGESFGARSLADFNIETHARHSYLRLTPELRARFDGPSDTSAPEPVGSRHPVVTGLDETDLIAFGGYLPVAQVEDAEVLATFVPDFPIYPPETSWMREPRTEVPAIIAKQLPAGGRLVWLLADLDRSYARDEQPDHATIIGNAVRWAIGDRPAFTIDADGLVSASLYGQPGRRILHLTNRVLTSRVPGREAHLVPVGPVAVRVRHEGPTEPRITSRVTGVELTGKAEDGYVSFEVDKITDHEVIVIEDLAVQ